jgi:cysteinyl-tRNA synthetase
MLRLTDARTGQTDDIVPAKAGLLRVYLCAPTDPRTALLADLVRRTASVNGLVTRVVDRTERDGIDLLLRGTVDVHVGPLDEHDEDVRHWVRAGGLDGSVDDADALRLLLLGTRYSSPVRITAADLDAAIDELRRWRASVASWAEEPSKPMCAEVQENLLAAFDDDLDTSRALQVLRDLETSALPAGCKFETAAWADRLLGLDLTRDVGT